MRHRELILIPGLAAALVAIAGCGAGGSVAGGLPTVPASPAKQPVPPQTAPPSTLSGPGGPGGAGGGAGSAGGVPAACSALTLTVRTDHPTYKAGQVVTISASLTNTGTTTCGLAVGADLGFSVTEAAKAVWTGGCSTAATGHTSRGECAHFQQQLPLAPKQTLTRTQKWLQQRDATVDGGRVSAAPAGSYSAVETWGGKTASAAFRIG